MSPYQGLLFFGVLILLLLPAVILGLHGRSLRLYGLAATLVMLLLIFDTWQSRLLLLLFWLLQTGLCFGYLALRKQRGERWLLWIALALSLVPLVLTKLGGLVPALRPLGFLGVSYMSFRAVQVLIEIYDGHIQALSLADLSYFLLFFPSVSSGPIDRYRRFTADLHRERSGEDYAVLLREGVWKLMTGAFYNFALGNLIWQLWLSPLPSHGFLASWSYLYGYTF